MIALDMGTGHWDVLDVIYEKIPSHAVHKSSRIINLDTDFIIKDSINRFDISSECMSVIKELKRISLIDFCIERKIMNFNIG